MMTLYVATLSKCITRQLWNSLVGSVEFFYRNRVFVKCSNNTERHRGSKRQKNKREKVSREIHTYRIKAGDECLPTQFTHRIDVTESGAAQC